MFIIQNSKGEYLTNYGMQKFWFSEIKDIAYTFDNLESAQRFSDYYNCTIISL
jgi:hypothetical protein